MLGLIRGHWGLAAELFTDLFAPDAETEDRAWFAPFLDGFDDVFDDQVTFIARHVASMEAS